MRSPSSCEAGLGFEPSSHAAPAHLSGLNLHRYLCKPDTLVPASEHLHLLCSCSGPLAEMGFFWTPAHVHLLTEASSDPQAPRSPSQVLSATDPTSPYRHHLRPSRFFAFTWAVCIYPFRGQVCLVHSRILRDKC